MAFKTDCGGAAMTTNVKLSNKCTTWNTRLQHIGKHDNEVILVTFSICNHEYISKLISKRERGAGITIICHSKYEVNAYHLKRAFPDLKIYVKPYVHAKLALIGPDTVWLSSENLGRKHNTFDASIGIQDTAAFDHYHAQIESLLRSRDTTEIKEVF